MNKLIGGSASIIVINENHSDQDFVHLCERATSCNQFFMSSFHLISKNIKSISYSSFFVSSDVHVGIVHHSLPAVPCGTKFCISLIRHRSRWKSSWFCCCCFHGCGWFRISLKISECKKRQKGHFVAFWKAF